MKSNTQNSVTMLQYLVAGIQTSFQENNIVG
jgi:hypothetical protein